MSFQKCCWSYCKISLEFLEDVVFIEFLTKIFIFYISKLQPVVRERPFQPSTGRIKKGVKWTIQASTGRIQKDVKWAIQAGSTEKKGGKGGCVPCTQGLALYTHSKRWTVLFQVGRSRTKGCISKCYFFPNIPSFNGF